MRDELTELCVELNCRQSLVWEDDSIGGAAAVAEEFGDVFRLLQLERFVERIARGQVPFFKEALARDWRRVGLGRLKEDFILVKRAKELLADQYSYSVYITELFEVIDEVGLSCPFLNDFRDISSVPREGQVLTGLPSTLFQWELFDELVVRLSQRLNSGRVKTALRVRRDGAERNFNEAIAYLDQCFDVYPQIHVLRLDLTYLPSLLGRLAGAQVDNGLGRIRQDAGRLFKKIGGGRWHPELFGYVAKLEYSKSRGHFLHLVVLLDASKKVRAALWHERVGQLWSQLTLGEGIAHNCSQEKRSKARSSPTDVRLGAGLMTRGSAPYRAFESQVLAYLAKSARFLRVKVGAGERAFFKGGAPRKEQAAMLIARI